MVRRSKQPFDKRKASALKAALSRARSVEYGDGKTTKELMVQQLELLLLVAVKPETSPVDYEPELNMTYSAVWRNLAALSDTNRWGKPGFGLIEEVSTDPTRAHRWVLSEKGERLVAQMCRDLSTVE